MADGRHLENLKIVISQLRFERFRQNLACRRSSTLLTVSTVKNLKFQNPRWRRPPSWTSENSHISAAVWAILTKFGTMVQFNPFESPDRKKCQISKIQDGGGRHLKKLKNRHISAAVQLILTKFGTVTQFGPRDCLARYRDLKKSKMPAAGILTS